MAYNQNQNRKGGGAYYNTKQNVAPQAPSVHTKAPYNFVPFSDKVIERYVDMKDLPAHDVIDPKLKSGEIHVTIKAETPVFISDGVKDDPHFFKGANGKYMLPGSSVRGMIRNNMYILGFGKVTAGQDVADQQLFYRKIASKRSGVDAALKDLYHGFMGIPQRSKKEVKQARIRPKKVQAGFLRNSNGKYEITPIKEDFFRLSRKDYSAWADMHAIHETVFYTLLDNKEVQLSSKKEHDGWHEAALLCPGTINPKKPNGIYLFPKEERGETKTVSEDDVTLYKADYENRKNALKSLKKVEGETTEEEQEKALSFWQLPKEGEEKPVFFIEVHGRLVWGMSLYLRIPYSRKLTDGLPKIHKTEKADDTPILDYVRSMMGFSIKIETEEKQEKMFAYRSRVSFGDFEAVGNVREMKEEKLVLGEPKPSFYAGYTVDGKHYEEKFLLRGYKHYWLKEARAITAKNNNENVGFSIRPLPKGTEFSGVIKYKNLHEDELGLLLWAIRLEAESYQSIGMAKPYGFGRVKISVDALNEYDFAKRYTTDGLLNTGIKHSDKKQVQKYIQSYQNCVYFKKEFGNKAGIMDQTGIQDFFYMRRKIHEVAEDVCYLELEEYANVTEPLKTVKTIREDDRSGLSLEESLDLLVGQYSKR